MPDLPSTIGSGWLQVSVDDRARDKKVIINNLIQELCTADLQARQDNRTAELTIEDFWSLKAFIPNYIRTFVEEFENEKHFIETDSAGRIHLTDLGRNYCTRF